jgi:hypothetical protein
VPEIHVERDKRGRVDRVRAYRVMLDGNEVGRVKRGETLTVTATPGQHELHFAIDWCRSAYQDLELADGETVTVRCWSNARPYSSIFYITFGRKNYIGAEVQSN